MKEHYANVRKEALDAMRRLTGQDVDDSCEDMERALEYTLLHGTGKQKSKAVTDYFNYLWAVRECEVHAAA